LLSNLGARGKSGNIEVIPLAYHVDYWNYIGWRDPFSSKSWTNRQRAYAARVSAGRVYTPQLVIGGRTHAVGSQKARVEAQIERVATRSPSAALRAVLSIEGRTATVTVPDRAGQQGALWVALYENDVATRVTRGENAGRELHNDYIVRSLSKGQPGQPIRFALEAGWTASNLGAVAFVQDPKTLAIRAAGRAARR
jgi:hypothetical protein